MKVLLFSDVHDDQDSAEALVAASRHADIALGAGDFCTAHHGLGETVSALSAISIPTLLVPGNNETAHELRLAAAAWSNATVLHGEGITIDGVSFWGVGGGVPTTPWEWSFDLTEDEARVLLAGCPPGAVLLTHSPAYGYLDGTEGDFFGSRAILETVESKKPRIAACGHVHECWGTEATIGQTRLFNVGPCGRTVELQPATAGDA